MSNQVELTTLLAEIEARWVNDQNHETVDKLAAENPQYAEELYEFFEFLVKSEFEPDEVSSDEERESEKQLIVWLELEGLPEMARRNTWVI